MFGLFKKKPDSLGAEIQPSGQSVQVKSGENLLRAALAAGLAWPHDCRVGSCGTCRCRLVKGKIKPLADFSYVLDGAQLKDGMILACQTALKTDVVIEVELGSADEAVSAIVDTEGVIDRARLLTHDIMEITIRLATPFPHAATPGSRPAAYRAGQYADIGFSGISQPRSYSFAKAPETEAQNELTFYIRKVPNGELTTWLFDSDRVGTTVTVSGPYGSFWLRDGDGPIVCIAGGSGMSSIKALLEHAANVGCPRDAVFLFGARTRKDLYCLEEMAALEKQWASSGHSLRFIPILSDEPADSDWQGLRGLVTEHIADQGLDWTRAQGYLCGPPPMIDAGIEALKKLGIGTDDIHFDKFLDASSMPGGRH
jgi:CDP-4-dehydro-6-deoxyglucose reductase